MKRAVHQFHPSLAPGDATSNYVFALRDRFRSWGYRSEAFAVEAKPGTVDVLPYRRLFRELTDDDLLVLHFSIGSEAFTSLVKAPGRKVLVYHNVTPPEFFEGINPHAARFTRLGRLQLRSLARDVPLAIGVSEFNRRDLEAAGFARTATVPLLVDWRKYDVAADPAVLERFGDGATNLLFVGRIAPNKRQDELVRLLAYARRCVDPATRLLLVGAYRDQPQYHGRVSALASSLGLDGAVVFTGPVTDAELAAYYGVATAFVSLSEHEGFAMPILEAFRFGVPVVALDAAAVGETAAGAALLFAEKDHAAIAETVELLRERSALRERLIQAGRERLRAFDAERVAARTKEVLGL